MFVVGRVVVVVVVDVDVVVGRGLVVVVVVGGFGRVVGGDTVGGGLGGFTPPTRGEVVVVVAAGRRVPFSAANVYQKASVGSIGSVVVVVEVTVVEVDAGARVVVVERATWMPRTSVVPTARPSRHFETPTTPSTMRSTTRRPLRIRSSGL